MDHEIQFIDLGGSKGGSYRFIQKKFAFQNGIAIDIDPKKVEKAIKNGVPAQCQDATNLYSFKSKSVKLVSMMHFLEHLPDIESVEKVLKEAIRVSSHSLYISGPMFYESYLYPLGVRFFWSNWSGHKCHVEPEKIIEILSKFCNFHYSLRYKHPVISSADTCIQPFKCIRNCGAYDSTKDPPKKLDIPFENIFKEFELVIYLVN